jgi:hypothetical protein
MMQRLRFDRVEVGKATDRPATWKFAGSPVRGTEYRYPVIDRNHRSRNSWEFAVRVPAAGRGRIEVRPIVVPNEQALAGLDRRSLTFMRGTKGRYARFRYCQLSLALPDGSATRDVVHRGETSSLPYWLRNLGWRIKQKATIRATRGTDGRSLAILVRPDDHQTMIRLFLGTKAWILKRGIAL